MATNTFNLNIIAANRVFFSGKCSSVIVPAHDGQEEIMAHHENMVSAVENGVLKFKKDGEKDYETVVVGAGFVETINNRVTVLVETAERPEEIDKVRAEEAKERAQEQLRQKQSIQEYYHSRASLSRAMTRLKATSGK